MGTDIPPIIQFLGESYGFWIQTGAIALSAIAAIIVIWHNGRMVKRRATIDLIISEQRDAEYNKSYSSISNLINSDRSLVDFAKDSDKFNTSTDSSEMDNIRFVLNRLEFIAQGIRTNAFEERIYKDLNYTNYIKLWDAVEPLVQEIRRKKQVQTYYQEMQWLATRWKKNPIRKI